MKLEPFSYIRGLQGCPPYDVLRWSDVLEIYRGNEEHLEHWKQYYQAQGYKSWEEWREKFFRRFGLRHLRWAMWEVTSPYTINYLRGANFRGWKRLTGEKHLTFGQMAMMQPVQKHEPLRDLINNFPPETTIIAVYHGGCIFVIEGMHRCTAYSLALREGHEIPTKIKIALGNKSKLFRPLLLGKRI